MAERDGKEEQLEQDVQNQSIEENKPDNSLEGKRRLSAPSCSTPNPKRAKLTTVDKKAKENETNKEDFMQDCSDNPPCINFEVPKLSDLPKACSKSWNDVELPVDFLLLTVKDCEFLGFFPYLEEPFKGYRKDIGYVWFGYMGSAVGSTKKLKIALMKCSKGSAVPGGSLTVVENAVRLLRPKSVFSVGACSGLSRGKVKLGDVVVSSKLITPTHKTPASRDIGTLIRHAADGWNAPLANPVAKDVRVHCDGEVLSCPEVISEDLIQQYPEAIAVETEGEGVFAAAHDLKTEWVLIKGIKDYADDSQPSSDEWGRFASVMAASVVANILSDPIVFEEWSHYNQETSPAEPFDVNSCRNKLAEHYERTATVPTSVWSKASPVDIHQIYTRLSWVKEEQTPAGTSQSELSHYTDVFTANKNGVVPKRILVQGQTGIGKSTFVKKLAVDWAELHDEKTEDKQKDALKQFENDEDMSEDREETRHDAKDTSSKDDEDTSSNHECENHKAALNSFELVLVINLKEVSKCPSLRDAISRCNIFPDEETTLVEGLLNYITKNQEKVLLVFDGYDEYRCGRNSEIYEVFKGKKLRNCCVLITTRITKADELREFKDIHAEITGFSEEDSKAFVSRMLGGEAEANELMWHLQVKNLKDLAKVPLLLLFFCTLWKKGKSGSFPESKTQLYLTIVQYILDFSQGKSSPAHFGKVHDFKEILTEIGKVALECLLKDDHVFEFDQLSAAILGEESLVIGLLQVTEYAENLRPAGMVSFIHKSLQEFLAAWYITQRHVPEGSLGEIEQHARSLEGCEALENVFKFVCGLSDEGAAKVFQHLTSVRISDPTLDLSKTIPDVENETDVPLCDVTDRHERFSDLVFYSFEEVHSKAELVKHLFNCTGRVVLVTKEVIELLQKVVSVKDLMQAIYCGVFDEMQGPTGLGQALYKLLVTLNGLQAPLKMTERKKVSTVGDFLRIFYHISECDCSFSYIFCFRDSQFQFYITGLKLCCNNHAEIFTKTAADSVPSEQSCLKFLTSLQCSNTKKNLGATIRDCTHLKRIELSWRESDSFVCDLLQHVQNPSKCSLKIGSVESWRSYCDVTSAGAVKLASLFPGFNNITTLYLDLSRCCPAAVDTLVANIAHKTIKRLALSSLNLSPGAVVKLGQSLLEMPSLKILELKGELEGCVFQNAEMEALFGGFNKTIPLHTLTFTGFVTSCLASLTKSFRFFPNLRKLQLEKVQMDEHNLCTLLDSLMFIPNLEVLNVEGGEPQRHEGCCTAEVMTVAPSTLKSFKELKLTGIDLTPAAAAALGRLDKTIPLHTLTFTGFMTSCLAPLNKNFRFFPNLRKLHLGKVQMDEHNLCGLLDSLMSIPNLEVLNVEGGEPQGHEGCCTAEVMTVAPFTLKSLKELKLTGINLTPAAAAALGRLLPEMSSLGTLKITGVDGRILKAKEMEVLFGGFNKTLPLHMLSFTGFSVSGCLSPLTKSFRFFPDLRTLTLSAFNMDKHNLCDLLENLRFIPNLKEMSVKGTPLGHARCCKAKVNTVDSFTHMNIKKLKLNRISLTPAVGAAFGRLLPEMPSLETLELTGVNRRILQAKEMEALFGGFNKTSPLCELTFSGFSVTGLAPLTKIFRFFPKLRYLYLTNLSLDEHDQCRLLESFRYFSNLKRLTIWDKPLGHAHCRTAEVNTFFKFGTLEQYRISLTPAVASTLGRSIPEMPSLQKLELTSWDGIILQANEMEALFRGFNKTMPLRELTLRGFSLKGGLAPLIQIFHFLPNLVKFELRTVNMDENDQCGLLASFIFIPNLKELTLWSKGSGDEHCCTAEVNAWSHKRLKLNGIGLTPAVAAALGRSLPEMLSLQTLELTGFSGNILRTKEIAALFGGFSKILPLLELRVSGFNVTGVLNPLLNSFRFFPSLRKLCLEEVNMNERDWFGLLDSLRFVPNLVDLSIKSKPLSHAHCRTANVNTVARITLKTLEQLNLKGISLTPAVARALGRSLTEMPSLKILKLSGIDGSILEAKEMEALFGGFNKTLPLRQLIFSSFTVTGRLAPLTKSLQFFPHLTHLHLNTLSMDEHDLCGLLESFQFIPDLAMLDLSGIPLGHAVRSFVQHVSNLLKLRRLYIFQTGLSKDDFNYVSVTTRQALPELKINSLMGFFDVLPNSPRGFFDVPNCPCEPRV